MTTETQLRDEGVDRVLINEGRSAFVSAAEHAMDLRIASGDPFSANEINADLADNPALPHHGNVLPALFSAAARQHRIVRYGSPVSARRAGSHASIIQMWVGADAVPEARSGPALETVGEALIDRIHELELAYLNGDMGRSTDPFHVGVRYAVRQLKETLSEVGYE